MNNFLSSKILNDKFNLFNTRFSSTVALIDSYCSLKTTLSILSRIFSILFKHHAKVNLVQNSAVSCSFALEVDDIYMPDLLNELSKEFKLRYNNNLELITIRHYQKLNVDALLKDKEVLLSQKNRTTLQVLYR